MQLIEARPAGCARILDPVTLNQAVIRAFKGLDVGTSLMVFAFSLLMTLVTGAVWWVYDLTSTYSFMLGVAGDTKPAVEATAAAIAKVTDPGVLPVLGALFAVAFTLFPSLVQLVAPRVMHPGAQIAMNVSIVFDFVTDWPTAAKLVAQAGGAPGGVIGHVFVTALLTLVISLFVQVLFVLSITALIVTGLNIVRMGGSSNGGGGVITIQQ